MHSTRIPSLNWLRVFDAAARHESFSSAGRELNMSAAAVSQQVAALETYLKKPLFERSANRVRLTAEGDEFLPTVQVSLQAIEAKAAALFPRKDVERISVMASQLMAMSWLPRVIAVFEQSDPSIRVDLLMEGTPRPVEPDLTIRFVEDPSVKSHSGWLMGSTYVVVGRRDDVNRIDRPEALLAFRLLDVLAHAVGWNTLLALYARSLKGPPLSIASVETTPLALAMVKEGLGLALVPWPVSRQLVQSLGLVVCTVLPAISGSASYIIEQPSGRSPRSAAQALIQALHHAADDDSVVLSPSV